MVDLILMDSHISVITFLLGHIVQYDLMLIFIWMIIVDNKAKIIEVLATISLGNILSKPWPTQRNMTVQCTVAHHTLVYV